MGLENLSVSTVILLRQTLQKLGLADADALHLVVGHSRPLCFAALDMFPHLLKGGDVGSSEQDALFSGHLVRHHVAALLSQ